MHQYVYDGENRLLSVDGSITYTYDAEGNRVAKFLNGVEENEYLYDLSDRLVAEIGPDSKLVSGNIDAGGLFLAEDGHDGYENGSGTMLRIADQVGTVRGRFDVFGNWVDGCTSLPFGDSETYGGPSVGDMFFTGKLRDTDTSLDDLGARDYSSVMGRFLTPDWSADPEPVPYAKLDKPQSLNLYSYAGNTPLSQIDIDGHCWDFLSGACDVLKQLGSGIHLSTWAAQQQTENVSATGQPATSGHPIDKDAITNYADQHAEPHSLGKCAAYCRRAFEAGGVDTNGHPVDAKDWGPTLLKNGATVISPDGYKPQKADVAVFAGSDAHPYGHITIYDGKQWVSDFKETCLRTGLEPRRRLSIGSRITRTA